MSQSKVARIAGVAHIGVTVSSLRDAIQFFQELLTYGPRTQGEYVADYIATLTNIPGAALDVAYFDLPGGVSLELTEYRDLGRSAVQDTGSPGAAHLSFVVDHIEEMWTKALAAGAQPVSPRVVEITAGPNKGGMIAYLRCPGDVTIELFEPRRLPAGLSGSGGEG